MAEHYPAATIVAVSNSAPQRRFIEGRLRERGMANVRVITADMNGFDPGDRFDRIVSVEMFEHMRNWGELFRRVASWLERDGRREQALRALASTGSGEDPAVLLQRWRIFFMACAELWGYGGGSEWWVSHYLLTPR